MTWHVYDIIPIDFGWENLQTVKETLKRLIDSPEAMLYPCHLWDAMPGDIIALQDLERWLAIVAPPYPWGRFYLQQCGATQLDRDGDGVPCERLCR